MHIGFCGVQFEEIYKTLQEDFIDQDGDVTFWIARNDVGEIVAAIGLDIDGNTAEVWGPFNCTSSAELQWALWKQLIHKNPSVRNYIFFVNQENIQQQKFMAHIQAEKAGEHLSLELKKMILILGKRRQS